MSLEAVGNGYYTLKGTVTFDNAATIEQEGKEQLLLAHENHSSAVSIDLANLAQADSSTLSVCLSWIRYAQVQSLGLCFTSVPPGLVALAKVCGIEHLLADSTGSTPYANQEEANNE